MDKGRLEAFSDGVIAIIITIMVLELKTPHGADLAALGQSLPIFLSYVLSFLYVGIYWNNHHHLLKACRRVTGPIMWANLHLLFWLSLFPFVTGWAGEYHLAKWPTALYGSVLLIAALAYYILQSLILADHETNSAVAQAFRCDLKGKLSPVCYALGIGFSFIQPWLGAAIYTAVALAWLIPDRRIETALTRSGASAEHSS